MEAARWIRGLTPLAMLGALAATGLGRPPMLSAAAPPWQPPPCPEVAPAAGETDVPAWYRLDSMLDETGTLEGRRLTLGRIGGRERHLDLSPESFASGPVDGQVVVGDDDGATSELRIIDVGRGCATIVAREADVIRGAVLSAGDGTIWEHRVDRATRTDLGVWRRGPGGSPAVQVLPGVAQDDRYGPTFSTELRLVDGRRLAVSSCGELACRSRILDPATGHVTSVEATGPMLGMRGSTFIAAGVCHGFPCPVITVDVEAHERSVIVREAGPAIVGGTALGVVAYAATDGELELVNLDTGGRSTVAGGAGLLPVRDGSAATSGSTVPVDDLLVAPDGLVSDPVDARAINPLTSALDAIEEAIR